MTNEILEYWYKRELLQPKGFPFVDEKKEEKNRRSLSAKVKSYRYAFNLCRRGVFVTSIPETLREDEKAQNQFRVIDSDMDVCVGCIPKEPLFAGLFNALGAKDTRHEEERGTVCLFAFRISCDESEQYIENSFMLSPFVWGVSQIARGADIQTEVYKQANCDEEIIRILSNTGLTLEQKITGVYRLVQKEYLSFTGKHYGNDEFDVTVFYSRFANERVALNERDTIQHEGDLRCSFILEDLEMLMSPSRQNKTFERYVGILNAPEGTRTDIRCDDAALPQVLDISRYPLGKWPSKHRPSLMQQVAINLAVEGRESIFSVNGPPGTGKTTLLKEIVADMVVRRAAVMLKFAVPDAAFEKKTISPSSAVSCNYLNNCYELKEKLAGYEMLVASCNNGAVENISRELPDYESMFDQTAEKDYASCFDLDKTEDSLTFSKYAKEYTVPDIYFSQQASELFSGDSNSRSAWGLVSVPLGNRGNIAKFLSTAAGILLFESDAAIEKELASGSFKRAQKEFGDQHKRVELLRQDLQNYRDFCLERERRQKEISTLLPELETRIHETEQKRDRLMQQVQEKKAATQDAFKTLEQIRGKRDAAVQLEETIRNEIFNMEARLHFWEKLLYKFLHTETIEYLKEKREALGKIRFEAEGLKEACSAHERQWTILKDEQEKVHSIAMNKEHLLGLTQAEKTALLWEATDYERNLAEYAEKKGLTGVLPFTSKTMEAFTRKDPDLHASNPWTTARFDVEREKLFYLAMKLHKYFVLSSKCVRDNLKLFAHVMGKKSEKFQDISFSDEQLKSFFTDVFRSLFLFVPVVSTTFASVQTMLRDMREPDRIGLLIVDEAGQAAPQMAAGALFRSKRALIVGDPKQIEPVVTFPDIFNDFFIKNDSSDKHGISGENTLKKYAAKSESVQTFADRMNPYGSYLKNEADNTPEWIGCPLTVHRRCVSPLFDISNALSYSGTMIQKTADPPNDSFFLREKSVWFCVAGIEKGNKNHFVREQGEHILSMLENWEKRGDDEKPVFVISPFTSVVEEMKKLLKERGFDSFVQCGTVHTFQGKETDEVFFLLGCDAKAAGAVGWVNSNLVNVAVTRARYRLYVVGDKPLWMKNDNLKLLESILERDK